MNETNDIDKLAFQPFNKLARLNREIVITEKLDGTNAQILITAPPEGFDIDDPANCGIWYRDGLLIRAGSRNRWLTPTTDNYGFANWVLTNANDLVKLGPGRHFGEWWGNGIQRGYGLKEKRFSLFNVGRWSPDYAATAYGHHYPGVVEIVDGQLRPGPSCVFVVPTLSRCPMRTEYIDAELRELATFGSVAARGFMDPEGIVIYHTAANSCFKVTLKNDESPKSLVK